MREASPRGSGAILENRERGRTVSQTTQPHNADVAVAEAADNFAANADDVKDSKVAVAVSNKDGGVEAGTSHAAAAATAADLVGDDRSGQSIGGSEAKRVRLREKLPAAPGSGGSEIIGEILSGDAAQREVIHVEDTAAGQGDQAEAAALEAKEAVADG